MTDEMFPDDELLDPETGLPRGLPSLPAHEAAALDGLRKVNETAAALAAGTQRGGSEPPGAHNPMEAGSTPAPASAPVSEVPDPDGLEIAYKPNGNAPAGPPSTRAAPTAFPALPEPPPLTGDPVKDAAANVAYRRTLTDHSTALASRHGEVTSAEKKIEAERARREGEAALKVDQQRQAERERYAADRQARQDQIDAAVQERATASKDIEGANWAQRNTGASVLAAIFGAVGQGLSNYAAAQLGQVGTAKNEGIETINRLVAQDYQRKKDRIARAGDTWMQARYGFENARDNHRAALNDLDADLASKWRLIAKETEEELRKRGADKATIEADQTRLTALQKAAEAEGAIHQREEGLDVQRDHNRATETMARAHLGLARSQLEATIGERAEKRAEKGEQRDAETAVFNPRTGGKLGNAPTKERASATAKQLDDFNRVRNDIQALKSHMETEGTVFPSIPIVGNVTPASKTRETLAKNLMTQLSSFKQLGAISKDDRQIIEGMMAGGTPAFLGASAEQLDVLAKAVDRAEKGALRAQGLAPKGEQKAEPKYPQAIIDKAIRAMEDPKAPPEAKKAAAKILSEGR